MKIKSIIRGAAKVVVVAAAAVTVWKSYAEVESIIEEDITANKEKAIDIVVAVAPVMMAVVALDTLATLSRDTKTLRALGIVLEGRNVHLYESAFKAFVSTVGEF